MVTSIVPDASRGSDGLRELDVIAVSQPSYLFDFGDEYLASLGEHTHELQPWRTELEAGIRVVISSDSDVSSLRPGPSRRPRFCGPTSGRPLPLLLQAE